MLHDLGDPHPHDRRLAQLRDETPADVAWAYRWQIAAWALGFALAVVVAVVLP